jgi:sulfatase modifying factor 1
MKAKVIVALVAVLLAAGAAMGQTHAPWPTNWNNWNDPTLWVTVGDPGNVGELSGAGAGGDILGNGTGGYGPDRVCGAVAYEYRIGKYEVTAGQYTEFLNKVAGEDTYALYNTAMWSNAYGCKIERYAGSGTVSAPYQYRVATDFTNRPVNYVSWGDAARFANWLHNGQGNGSTETGAYYLDGAMSEAALEVVSRKSEWKYAITSEDEWYKAAYYKGGETNAGYWDYPTCNDPMTSNDMIDPDPGNNATFYDHGYTIGSPYYRTEVGEFELSGSPYGTFD